MFEIEYGADYSDSVKVIFPPENWDYEMSELSRDLAGMVDRRLIAQEDFEQSMEWITGVVVDDVNVRVPATFGDLTVAITLTGDDD